VRSFKTYIVHTAVFSCQCRCRRQRRPVNTSQQEVSWSEVNIQLSEILTQIKKCEIQQLCSFHILCECSFFNPMSSSRLLEDCLKVLSHMCMLLSSNLYYFRQEKLPISITSDIWIWLSVQGKHSSVFDCIVV